MMYSPQKASISYITGVIEAIKTKYRFNHYFLVFKLRF